MNSVTGIFQQHFKLPQSPPCINLSLPHVLNTCGKPCDICPLRKWEMFLGEEFLCGGGWNLRNSGFDHSNLFQS